MAPEDREIEQDPHTIVLDEVPMDWIDFLQSQGDIW